MLFSLTILIPAVVFWYNNIQAYKKLELINKCISNSDKSLIVNINIKNLIKNPLVTSWSKKKWIYLNSDEYEKVKLVHKNYINPLKNKTLIVNEYLNSKVFISALENVNNVNINPIMKELGKKYIYREEPFIIFDKMQDKYIEDFSLEGTNIIKQNIGKVYYNNGIPYDNLNCTIIGKVKNNTIDKFIIEKQKKLNVQSIKNNYLNKIAINTKLFSFFIFCTFIFIIIEHKK